MKIFISGSMYFAKEMLEHKNKLEGMGHVALVPGDTHLCIKNPDLNIDLEHALSTDIQGKCFEEISKSDAILVLNYKKNDIEGYVGGNTLMEMGFANVHNKKVFLMNPIPEQVSYVDEIKAMTDQILNGDLNKIS